MKILICLGFLLLVCIFAPGCTIHFKGENLELEAERQRVYKFDGLTFTKAPDLEITGPRRLYTIDNVRIFRSKPQDILYRKTKFIAAGKIPRKSAQ